MSPRIILSFLLIAMTLAIAPTFAADVTPVDQPFLHGVFTDNMVLQRDVACPVWGWTEPGKEVTVTVAEKTFKTVADADGKWLAKVGPFPAGGPYTLAVSGPQNVTLKNVLFGDVWLCSGQSNMQMSVKAISNSWGELQTGNLSEVRLMSVPLRSEFEPAHSLDVEWRVCSPDLLSLETPFRGGFSAIAFLFGRQIHETTKVPIGLIEDCWGATDIRAWSTLESVRSLPDYRDVVPFKHFEKKVADVWAKIDPSFEQTKGWSDPGFDSAGWKSMELPRDWKSTPVGNFSGVVWFRRQIKLSADWAGKDLFMSFGPIESSDTVWFNGTFVGACNSDGSGGQPPRYYKIPADLVKTGDNCIAVRVLGDRGFNGKPEQMYLRAIGTNNAPLPLTGAWQYCQSTPSSDLKGGVPERRHQPTGCFNGMIAPLAPFAIKGVLWYQGENNGDDAAYEQELTNMIKDWRTIFGVGDFPFYIVQLSGFGKMPDDPSAKSGWAIVREAQLNVSQKVPNTGLAVSIDRGEIYDIHPPNKQDVAKRLAWLALKQTYGQDVECFGPTYRSMKIEGDTIRVTFDHLAGGLVARGGGLTGFAIAGADKKFVWASAIIDGDTITVSSPQVLQPVAVRYGWADNILCNLYNKADLPASPFRTDSEQP